MSSFSDASFDLGSNGRLAIAGELSIRNAAELKKELAEALDRATDLAVDLSLVSACDTAVLQLLYSLAKTAGQRGRSARIAALSPVVEEVAASLGLPISELAGANAGPGGGCSGV